MSQGKGSEAKDIPSSELVTCKDKDAVRKAEQERESSIF